MVELDFIKFMFLCSGLYVLGLFIFTLRKKRPTDIKIDRRIFNKIIIDKINDMSGNEFESFCTFVLSQSGYMAMQTKATNDGGKDIVLIGKNCKRIYVECKRYQSCNLIGRELIQKLVGACVGEGVTKAMFITTSGFNRNAKAYADNIKGGIEVELVDLDEFLKMISKINQNTVMGYFDGEVSHLKLVK